MIKIISKKVPEIAGVSMPSAISMHIPSIAMKSNILCDVLLFSKNLPNLLVLELMG